MNRPPRTQPETRRRTTPAGVVLARAILRRCPNCGARRIFRNYFQQHDVCHSCSMKLDRGEKDFFIGAYTLNLIVAEMIVFFGGLAVLLGSWPDVPWTGLTWGLAGLMVAAPIILYPWSRQVWLALDLVFRPAEPDDFASGDSSGADAQTIAAQPSDTGS